MTPSFTVMRLRERGLLVELLRVPRVAPSLTPSDLLAHRLYSDAATSPEVAPSLTRPFPIVFDSGTYRRVCER